MSKKRLKDGLESLFEMPKEDVQDDAAYLGDNVSPKKSQTRRKKTTTTARKTSRSKASHKSFTADLESLFQAVVSESVREERKKKEEKATSKTKASSEVEKAKTVARRATGLDALIRNTVAPNKEAIQQQAAATPKNQKRVTFVFEKDKLLKLKQIAKLEKAYLKDIIGGLISEYIDEYQGDDSGDKK